MPNYCNNCITVQGDSVDIANLYEAEMSLQKLHPCPYLDDNYKVIGKNNVWFMWCVQNWGTKGSIECNVKMVNENTLNVNMTTAWSPPIEFLKHLSTIMLSLTFTIHFWEPGARIAGAYEIRQGVESDITKGEYMEFVRNHFDSDFEEDEEQDETTNDDA